MNGRLMLREVAQCKEEDLISFQDVAKHRYFNTNNLWLDLEALSRELDASPGGRDCVLRRRAGHRRSAGSFRTGEDY